MNLKVSGIEPLQSKQHLQIRGFVKIPIGIVDISPRSLVVFGTLYVYFTINFKKRFKRPHGHRANMPTLKAG